MAMPAPALTLIGARTLPGPLFKQDHPRSIDQIINFFGDDRPGGLLPLWAFEANHLHAVSPEGS